MTDSYSEFSFSVEYYIEFILTFFFLLITTGSKGSFIYKKKKLQTFCLNVGWYDKT